MSVLHGFVLKPQNCQIGNIEASIRTKPLVDPGFLRREGGANHQRGAPIYYLAKFVQKMAEIWKRLDQLLAFIII